MTRDTRLYARFDIGMDEHPKIMLLSDAAFRVLIESTFYARRQMTDGFLAEGVVLRKWGQTVATELESNHPERPSWIRVEGGWQIRDFGEHQTTRADVEKKRESGRAGGVAKAQHSRTTTPSETSSEVIAGATETLEQTASNCLAKTETETETETSTSNEVEKRATHAARLPNNWMPSTESVEKAKADAPDVDHQTEHTVFVDYWIAQPGQKGVKTNWDSTWRNWMRRKQADITARGTRRQGAPSRTEQNLSVVELYRQQESQRGIGA